jgi:hypothetical protein
MIERVARLGRRGREILQALLEDSSPDVLLRDLPVKLTPLRVIDIKLAIILRMNK